jgi:gas vesicle protein
MHAFYDSVSGIQFASTSCMSSPARPVVFAVFAVACGLIACDDTGKAIKDEVKEIDKQQVKQDLKDSAAAVGSAAKEVGHEAEKAIDKVDKKVAEEIRKD